MPTISFFYGIFIRMYLRDHPPPHFHAIYQGHEAFIAIETGEALKVDCRRSPHGSSSNGLWRTERNCSIIGSGHEKVSRSSVLQDSTMISVISFERLGGHRLRIRFSDGTAGEHDFSAMTHEPGPMIEPLRNAEYFARVFLDYGALTWPNGFDIAPEWLRREMAAAGELHRDAA